MSDFNIDKNSLNNLKNILGKDDLSNIMSKVTPEMLENMSNILNQNNNNNNDNDNNNNENSTNYKNTSTNDFNMNNIDINSIMKMKSIMDKMNDNDNPRNNLLSSLKPYLRDEKKEKLDQYANLMNIAKITDFFKNEKKENNNG